MITLVFPGQGAQYTGMGKDLYDNNFHAKLLFNRADRAAQELGLPPITELCFEADADTLKQTKFTQPAMYTVSMAAYKALAPSIKKQTRQWKVQAGGHSVGEYAALGAAGFYRFEQGLKLVTERAKIMDEEQTGTLGAIVGIEKNELQSILDKNEKVWIALHNSPGQYVVGGEEAYVDRVLAQAIEKGAHPKLSQKLKVSGAFHTPLYDQATEKFRKSDAFQFVISHPKLRVISNFSGEFYVPNSLKTNLIFQINHPVEWELGTRKLLDRSDTFIELGPGKTVSGMVKKTAKKENKEVTAYQVNDMKSLEQTVSTLK